MPIFIQHHTCQLPGRKRTGIDIDAVWQHFQGLHRGVAVHGDLAEIYLAAQKFVADL